MLSAAALGRRKLVEEPTMRRPDLAVPRRATYRRIWDNGISGICFIGDAVAPLRPRRRTLRGARAVVRLPRWSWRAFHTGLRPSRRGYGAAGSPVPRAAGCLVHPSAPSRRLSGPVDLCGL